MPGSFGRTILSNGIKRSLFFVTEQNQNTNGHLGWQPAVQNLDERIIELESNRHSDSAVLMAHSDKLLSLELDRNISNRALQDLHSRVTSSEGNFKHTNTQLFSICMNTIVYISKIIH